MDEAVFYKHCRHQLYNLHKLEFSENPCHSILKPVDERSQKCLTINSLGNCYQLVLIFGIDYHSDWAVDKTRIGLDRIGSDRTHKTWMGSNSIKETHTHSLKVDAFQIPIKDDEERSRK